MEYSKLTAENLDREHICCAISDLKDPQVLSKKQWLRERFDEGLVFIKADIRGKCFIEYIPAEHAWVPIVADDHMHINCFWVSGSCKGQGFANELLDRCIADAKSKGKKGLTVISSPKKMPFLSDPKFLSHKGFTVADKANPYFTLMHLPLEENTIPPRFREQVRNPITDKQGISLYYTCGCPFTAKYVPLIENRANELGVPFEGICLDSRETAQNAPAAWTNYALFYDGIFVTNEILSEKKFISLCETWKKKT